jgi:hypothetical protein
MLTVFTNIIQYVLTFLPFPIPENEHTNYSLRFHQMTQHYHG